MDEMLTVDEVAKNLKISTATVRRMLARGDIRARKVGARQWRVPAAALESYIDGGTAGEANPAKKGKR